ncbi:MAG: HU family DNA-binding protein [Gammaproteobacteria bacterium]|nr:HU family DNA-binding protein [Gammaproteobacteria bacterium]
MPKKTAKKGKMATKKGMKKAVCVCNPKKPVVVKEPFGKGQILRTIAENICLTKKEVTSAVEALMNILEAHLQKRGPGEFTLPGVAKFRVIRKPATKARQGVNPFTGEPMVFAAKPARNVVKIRALKKLKDLVK